MLGGKMNDRYVGAVEASDWCTRHAILNSTGLCAAIDNISTDTARLAVPLP